MRIKLLGLLRTPNLLNRAQANTAVPSSKLFSTKAWKTTSDAKILLFLGYVGLVGWFWGKNIWRVSRDHWPYPYIMEDHYDYEQRLLKEAAKSC